MVVLLCKLDFLPPINPNWLRLAVIRTGSCCTPTSFQGLLLSLFLEKEKNWMRVWASYAHLRVTCQLLIFLQHLTLMQARSGGLTTSHLGRENVLEAFGCFPIPQFPKNCSANMERDLGVIFIRKNPTSWPFLIGPESITWYKEHQSDPFSWKSEIECAKSSLVWVCAWIWGHVNVGALSLPCWWGHLLPYG